MLLISLTTQITKHWDKFLNLGGKLYCATTHMGPLLVNLCRDPNHVIKTCRLGWNGVRNAISWGPNCQVWHLKRCVETEGGCSITTTVHSVSLISWIGVAFCLQLLRLLHLAKVAKQWTLASKRECSGICSRPSGQDDTLVQKFW